ncbi:hypothetical protein [Mycobacterium sp. 852002-30065_SCH5024008]|uniref:hypothetical protein n=1 Tax=Mycobacterium sp. 852002-30065_SCH5024008 TaxID=1834088 RepID=UPI0012E98C10|nr:hypothetical protein [Mycobacterium sp. 852002-30065_SCH5024008]
MPLGGASCLIKLNHGALLYWRFDEPDDDTVCVLLVRLTDKEARAVHKASYLEGMLEPVRAKLKFPGALLAVGHGDKVHVRRFVIPRHGIEHEFVDDLMNLAERVADHRSEVRFGLQADSANLKAQVARYQEEAQQYRGEIERLNAERRELEGRLAHGERLLVEELASEPEVQFATSILAGKLVSS